MRKTPLPDSSPCLARRGRGFTLVELIAAVTVLAILAAIGVPSLRSFLQNNRNSGQAQSLILMLTLARNEALKRDVAAGVTVCPSADGKTCDPAGNWSQAWIIPDPVTPTNPPLQAGVPLSASNTITEANGQVAVVFLPSGAVLAPVAFRICDARGGTFAREFEVNQSGRVIASPVVGQTVNGAPVACP